MFGRLKQVLKDASRQFGLAAEEKLKPAEAALWQHKLLKLHQELIDDWDRTPPTYPHYAGFKEYSVHDWRVAPTGMLVTHSMHYYRERGKPQPEEKEIGILTRVDFFRDGKGRVIAHPNIYWEKGTMSSMCHPMNVRPYRDEERLPLIKMDDGQWGTNGPETAGADT